MFDTAKEFEISIFSGGPKKCVVRWPSDDQWRRRAKQSRIRQELTGRDKGKSAPLGVEAAALEMFEAIRLDSGEPFDGAEALEVVDRLEFCELWEGEDGEASLEVTAEKITVRMAALKHRGKPVFTGLLHVMRMPSMQQMRAYRLGCVQITPVRRGSEMTQPLEPGAALFDAIVERSQGYQQSVPIVHKDFVVCRVLEAIRELEDEGGD